MDNSSRNAWLIVLLILVAAAFQAGPALAEGATGAPTASGATFPPRLYLPLVLGTAPLPTSYDLIDRAVSSGAISSETALVYKVYVSFNDPRLPQQYRGDDSGVRDSMITAEVNQRFDSLSPQAQVLLAPFLLPPSAPGSWLELRAAGTQAQAGAVDPAAISWGKIPAADNKAVVWYELRYPGDDAVAREVAEQLASEAWPDLTGVMAREPLSDAGVLNNGGDARFDVYLIHFPPPTDPGGGTTMGQAPAYDPRQSGGGTVGCQETPAYLLIDSRLRGNNLHSAVAHEFMHAIQWSYPVNVGCVFPGEYAWFVEASATWAEHYVYPGFQTEHPRAQDFLNRPGLALEDRSDQWHIYGAYLWPFYLTRGEAAPAKPDEVRTIWQNFKDYDSLEAIDKSIPGGFKEQWPKFALRNWNRPPVDGYADSYKQTDGLLAHGAFTGEAVVKLGALAEASYIIGDTEISHLATAYYRYIFPDDSSHLVTFFNGLTFKLLLKERSVGDMPVGETYALVDVTEDQAKGAKKGARVQALAKIGGKWQDVEDWTDKPYRTYCRDKASERIEELVIIFSNSVYEPRDYVVKPQGLVPMLWASNIGCWQWSGTANTVNGSGYNSPTFTTHSEVVWERVPAEDVPDDGLLFEPYLTFQPLSGQVDWTVAGTESDCPCSGADRYLLGRGGGYLRLYPYSREGPYWRKAFGLGFYSGQYTQACPTHTYHPVFMDFWFGLLLQQVSADGATLQFEGQDAEDYMKVDFQAQSQP